MEKLKFNIIFLGLFAPFLCFADKPNVLFLFADDMTFEAIASLGLTEVKTPNLDKLAERGTQFSHAYNMGAWGGAVCVASRSMLISGLSLHRAKEGVKTHRQWPDYMEDAGYKSYIAGKWHIPVKPDFDVEKNVRPGMPNQVKEGYNRPKTPGEIETGWKPWDTQHEGFWKGGKHWTEVLADDTIAFIEVATEDEKPFFIYTAFNAPHDPRQAPKEFVDMYPWQEMNVPVNMLPEYPYHEKIGCNKTLRDEKLIPFPRKDFAVQRNRAEYFACITHMDREIGRILDALEASGKADNTYIVFTSDHGLAVGRHGLVGKQNMYDHSMRVPFIVSGPDIPKGKVLDQRIYLQDIMPAAINWAGGTVPDHVEFKDFMPLIRGERTESYTSIYGSYLKLQRMVQKGDWKLIIYPSINVARLYNTAKDPLEMKDVSEEPKNKEVLAMLINEFHQLQTQLGDNLQWPAQQKRR